MLKPERLAALSDGVIAIAITLLVLGLQLPSVHQVPEQQLNRYLVESLHALIGYVSSFVLIGTYWLQHYVIFHYITHVDRVLIALNGVFLLCVSFVPFPTGLQAAYRHDELAMVLYAGTQAICGLSLLALWGYATRRHRLVAATTSHRVIRGMSLRLALTPLTSLVAMLVSCFSINLSRVVFLAIPAACLVRWSIDTEWTQSGDAGETPAR